VQLDREERGVESLLQFQRLAVLDMLSVHGDLDAALGRSVALQPEGLVLLDFKHRVTEEREEVRCLQSPAQDDAAVLVRPILAEGRESLGFAVNVESGSRNGAQVQPLAEAQPRVLLHCEADALGHEPLRRRSPHDQRIDRHAVRDRIPRRRDGRIPVGQGFAGPPIRDIVRVPALSQRPPDDAAQIFDRVGFDENASRRIHLAKRDRRVGRATLGRRPDCERLVHEHGQVVPHVRSYAADRGVPEQEHVRQKR
jgi:hypothetical protein